MKMKEYRIDSKTELKEALQRMDTLKPKILFVESDGYLVGALTDGDVRRYMIAGGKTSDLVEMACNKNPKVAHSGEEAEEMLNLDLKAIPVIDEEGRLLDVYTGLRKMPQSNLDVPVVINAGGKGTRLEPFTKVLPKPLIPVGELPILEHIMQRFESFGCSHFSIIVNYKKDLIRAYFADLEKHYDIEWFEESKPLGTGGGLSLLKGKLPETFFFVNCDILLLSDYEDMLRFHKEKKNKITMICAQKKMVIPYGIVENDEEGMLTTIKEKPSYDFLVNTGLYIVDSSVVEMMEDDTRIDFPDIIKSLKEKGERIGVYAIDGEEWLDMGQMSELEKMRKRLYGEDA